MKHKYTQYDRHMTDLHEVPWRGWILPEWWGHDIGCRVSPAGVVIVASIHCKGGSYRLSKDYRSILPLFQDDVGGRLAHHVHHVQRALGLVSLGWRDERQYMMNNLTITQALYVASASTSSGLDMGWPSGPVIPAASSFAQFSTITSPFSACTCPIPPSVLTR